MSGSTILSYISILKGYDVHGGDDEDLPESDFFQRDISLKITNLGFQSRFLVEYRPGITSVRDEAQSLTNNCLGNDARHSTPEVVMRMLSVVSSPQFSCQMPVMK